MCGISGILRLRAEAAPPDREELARMHAALARRGPDGEGTASFDDGRLLLAHRRLAILDPTPAGAQPMATADRRFAVVFNGEIYNFRELAAELAAAGVELRTHSDTEVLLELYRREGLDGFARLRGMFAFALWDAAARRLVLARDPYGIKPLYYSLDAGTLRFASQVKALEAGGGVSAEIDPAAVAGFLSWGAVPEPLTLRKAIRALPAGHCAVAAADGSFRIERLPEPRAPEPLDIARALAESVRAHLVSDVPVGIFLSAGLDSAAVAALAMRNRSEPLTAITLTWKEVRGTAADEAPLAAETARRLGLRHVVREIDGEEVRDALPRILEAMDQPSIDGFNTWLVARVAREEGLKVVLSGLGGDELLGGYSSFRDVPRWVAGVRKLDRVPGLARLWPVAARVLRPGTPKLASLMRYGGSFAGAYALRRAVFLPHEVDAILARAGLAEPGRRPYDAPYDAWTRLREADPGPSSGLLDDPWRVVHALESSIYLRNQLLRDADWAGMAHGVEIRVPLVDDRLRRTLSEHGGALTRRTGKGSAIRATVPEISPELFVRSKTGFQLPVWQWIAENPDSSALRNVGDQSRALCLWTLARLGLPNFEKMASGNG